MIVPAPIGGIAPSTDESGSEETFYVRFVGPVEKRMMRTIWRIVRDADQARDVLQESLMTIWRRRGVVENHPNPEALILRICIHAAIGSLRTLQRRQRFEADGGPTPQARLAEASPAPDEGSLSEIEVRRAVGRLPDHQAAALLLRVVEEEHYSAVAAALGCNEVTARIHVLRARRTLRRWLSHLAPVRGNKGGDK